LRAGAQTRTEGQLAEAEVQATADVTKAMLPLLDNLERAAAAFKCDTPGEERVLAAYRAEAEKWLDALRARGVSTIEARGAAFDPAVHEGVAMEASDEFPDGVVSSQLQRGYVIGARLVRPALVAISSGPGPASAPPASGVAEDSAAPEEGAVTEEPGAKEEGSATEEGGAKGDGAAGKTTEPRDGAGGAGASTA